MISVGDLDTPIKIQSLTFSNNDNYGGVQKEIWAQATGTEFIWAHIVYRGGKESEEAQQKVGEQKVDFYFRYDETYDAIQPDWRIGVEKRDTTFTYYYIESIAEVDGRHKIIKVTATAKDNN